MLVEAARSVGRMHGKNKSGRTARPVDETARDGPSQVAVAHSILVAPYWMLKCDEPYHDSGAGTAAATTKPTPDD